MNGFYLCFCFIEPSDRQKFRQKHQTIIALINSRLLQHWRELNTELTQQSLHTRT
jgi:hypothetical protein